MKKVGFLSMVILCIFTVFLFSSKSAFADAIATSYAELDWSGLTYSISPSSGLSKYFLTSSNNTSSYYFYEDTGGNRYREASYLNGQMTSESQATSLKDGATYSAQSSSSVSVNLGVQGSGIITVSIPYIITIDYDTQSQGPRWNDTAIAEASVSLFVHSIGATSSWSPVQWWASESAHIDNISDSQNSNGFLTETGVLSISIPFSHPSEYSNVYGGVYFTAWSHASSYAHSQIPELSTMLLLGLGLIGLVGIRRKMK